MTTTVIHSFLFNQLILGTLRNLIKLDKYSEFTIKFILIDELEGAGGAIGSLDVIFLQKIDWYFQKRILCLKICASMQLRDE